VSSNNAAVGRAEATAESSAGLAMKRVIAALDEAHARLAEADRQRHEPIAIVGLACRSALGDGADELWQALLAGRDGVRPIPLDRWPDAGPTHCREAAMLADVAGFDAAFFAIAPREAIAMDPQQRLVLETAWEALEDAAIAREQFARSATGVFVGITSVDYGWVMLGIGAEHLDGYAGPGTSLNAAAGRLSYVLGLHGPSMAVDTACSSSLVTVHLACRALRAGECTMALAGGVNLILSPLGLTVLSKAGMLSPDGRSKPFDASADGYGRGEGCGVVVLKRLSDAQAAGDRILAVIRGSAVNHGGAASGLTVPNGHAQEAVLRAALRDARVSPADVDLVETHGTGTSLGDPIEAAALGRVFAASERSRPLVLGAVKGNFGHLEAAAGIIGLIKVVQCLRHEAIPANLHLKTPNPLIPWERLAMELPRQNRAWRGGGRPRVAGVSSFGISGTNAHVIVSEAPARERAVAGCERGSHLLLLSARTPAALAALCGRMADRVAGVGSAADLGDVCFTANSGRSRFAHGLAVVGSTASGMAGLLASAARGETPAGVQRGMARGESAPKVAFLFTGQGAQHVGMGRDLYAGSPVFRAAIDRCAGVLDGLLERPLVELLHACSAEDLAQTGNTQPALFAVEWALAALWRAWGIEPAAVLGHSVGEYVAACVAGVMEVEDALRLVAARGRLMQALPADAGAMVAVLADEVRVADLVAGHAEVSIAAVNGPGSVVVSGRRSAVREIAERLSAAGVRTHPLAVSHAFHSPLMAPMLEAFGAAAERVAFRAPVLPLVSNVTGAVLRGAPTAGYWVEHVSAPVRFADGVATLARSLGCTAMLELGPRPTLLGLGRAVLPDHAGPWLASLRPERPDWEQMLGSLGALALGGGPVDWRRYDQPYGRQKTALPTYPFQRQRFWYSPGQVPAAGAAAADLENLAAQVVADGALSESERAALPGLMKALRAAQAAMRPVAATASSDILSGGLYEVAWHDAPASEASPPDGRLGRWVVFADDGFGNALSATIAARGGTVVRVRRGVSAARDHDGGFRVAPGRPKDFEWLWRELRAHGPLTGVVYCWALDADTADIETARTLSAEAPMWVMRQLLAADAGRLWLVGRGAVDAGDDTPLAPAQAPLWGLAKAFALECPRQWGGFVDMAPGLGAAALLPELCRSDDEDQVALRGGRRLVPRLARMTPPARRHAPVDARAAYLVTGGLGGLGLAFADWLVRQGARHVWLLGRNAPDEGTLQAITALRRQGAEVVTVAADIADAAAMAEVTNAIAERGAPLKGVLHAAGVHSSCLVGDMTPDEIERTYRAKMRGAWTLHQATLAAELDFFVLFSSISATWGSKAQAHYAGANAFLDLLARVRRQAGRPASSIAWGPWQGVGMMREDISAAMRRIGITALGPEENIPVLSRLVGAGVCQATVAQVDWSRLRPVVETAGRRPFFDLLIRVEAVVPEAVAAERPLANLTQLPGEERSRRCLTEIKAMTATILGLDALEVEIDRGFFDMGFDSLMGLELKNRLEVATGIAWPATLVFDYPTIRSLAEFIAAGQSGGADDFVAGRPPDPLPIAAEDDDEDINANLDGAVSRRLERLEALMRQG
jgi:acyl transferase domain-containing protein/acyl carrier protein